MTTPDSVAVPPSWPSWRKRLHAVIFEHEPGAGRAFDVALIWSILISVAVVMLDSIGTIRDSHGRLLYSLEWFFTLLFSVEYVLRLLCSPRPVAYARSFFGMVDLASILPTYVSLLLPGSQYLQVIRVLRVLRVFRVLKLAEYIGEADILVNAIRNSRRKLSIFIAAVLTLAVIFGAAMHLVEGATHGFTSIPLSIYWTIVTITTVGYGDIAPATALGQLAGPVIHRSTVPHAGARSTGSTPSVAIDVVRGSETELPDIMLASPASAFRWRTMAWPPA